VQYAAVDYASMSTLYAANRSVAFPTTPNFAGTATRVLASGATPLNDYVVNIPLAVPFVYDPSLGQDLLIEFLMPALPTGVAGTNEIVTSNTILTHKCQTLRAFGTGSPTITSGGLSVFAPLVRLTTSVPPSVAKHDPYGQGCYGVPASWYENFPGAYPASTNDLSNTTIQAFPNGNGGHTVVTLPGSNLVLPTGPGLGLGDDEVSAAIALPFTFNYPGGSTSTIYVDSNGSIALGGAAAPTSANNPTGFLSLSTPRICASMQDLLPDGLTNVANVFAEVDPNDPSVFLITWVNVPCYAATVSANTSTFQIALIDGGPQDTFELRYLTLSNDSDSYSGSAVTGFTIGGGAIDGGSHDLTAGVIDTAAELGPLTLFASPRPIMGTPVTYSVSNIRPAGFSMMVVSLGQDITGTPLATYGLNSPGCNFHVTGVGLGTFGPLLFGGPTDGFSFTWPTGYNGVQIYVQAFELATGPVRENPSGIISSNGLKIELGIN
jgi:hypothetical protein